jgi:hypoxanthine phosphoribosyltransferase
MQTFQTINATEYPIRNCSAKREYPEIVGTLLHRHTISQQVANLGLLLNQVYAGQRIITMPILLGAMTFCADLERLLMFDVRRNPLYLANSESNHVQGKFTVLQEPTTSLADQRVLVIEDSIRSGLTPKFLRQYLLEKGVVEVRFATLLSVPSQRVIDEEADYTCFTVRDHLIAGYGMDYRGGLRHLPDVCVLDEHLRSP